MCNSRYADVIAVAVSILLGIALTALAVLNLLTAPLLTPAFGLGLGAFSLLLLLLGAASLLRQNKGYNRCIERKGRRLLYPAFWLIVISMFTLIFAFTNLIIGLILAFLLFTLMSLTFFGLFCFLSCLLNAAREEHGCAS